MKHLTSAILLISLIGFTITTALGASDKEDFTQKICKSADYEITLTASNELQVENFESERMTIALYNHNGVLLAKTNIDNKSLSFSLDHLNKDKEIFYTLIYENGQHHEGSFSLINSNQETLAFN